MRRRIVPGYGFGILLGIAAATCWSLGGVLVRLTDGIDSWQIVLYRSLTVLVLMGALDGPDPWSQRLRGDPPCRVERRRCRHRGRPGRALLRPVAVLHDGGAVHFYDRHLALLRRLSRLVVAR